MPIAADELLLRNQSLTAIIEARAVDTLILKPSLLGGPFRCLELAEKARRAGIDIVVTSALDGVIGRLGALHLASALRIERACGLATGAMLEQDLAPFPKVEAGLLRVPEQAGLGEPSLLAVYVRMAETRTLPDSPAGD